jgi:hypothetical protein
MYKWYVQLEGMGPGGAGVELFEIEQPTLSVHNLILGTPYMDIGGKSIVKNLTRKGETCTLEYFKKGWSG